MKEGVFPKGKGKEMWVHAGRPFKLKLRERFLMLLVYYRLYITFTLSGFLFDLDQSNVCRYIYARATNETVCSIAKEVV